MSFANPMFLWAFLALIPLAAIYLLKVRPVRKPTTAWFLWEDIFQENKAKSLFQRLRDLFSLLLMLAAFSAIVLALARPTFSSDTKSDLILLIDNSASMNAKDSDGVRLDQAIKTANEIVVALNGNQRCSVATVSDRAEFLSNLTDNPNELLAAIEKVKPTALASRIEVLRQFQSQNTVQTEANVDPNKTDIDNDDDEAEPSEADADDPASGSLPVDAANETNNKTRILLISDGNFEGDLPAGVELLKVGQSKAGNVGLVACDMRRLPGGSGRVGFFFQVASSYKKTVEAELTLNFEANEDLKKFIPLEIKPGLNPPEVFELEEADSGKWFVTVRTYPRDSLEADDQAFVWLAPERKIPVAVVGENPYFYENCILAFSQQQGLLSLTNVGDTAKPPELIIGAGNFAVPDTFAGDLVIFQPNGESPYWEQLGEEVEIVEPRTVDATHPVTRHIDPTLIPYVGSRRLQAPPGAEVLVKAEDDTPLIYRATHAGRSAVVLNFDPQAADFYFSAWFPVIVYSAATNLAGRDDEPQASWHTGQFAAVPGVDEGEKTMVVKPDGASIETQQKNFGPLKQTGFYEFKNDSGDWIASSSLLSSNETMLNNLDQVDNSEPINRQWSPVAWLTLLAIAVLCVESILYQRRKVG
ncbi:BatA and WFA domain-containing protein [Mariniblastus sp.]|nr:BatA and WFA domain-containing protein [Mariniblastus sp.]